MSLVKSLVLSIAASVACTYLLRRALMAMDPPVDADEPHGHRPPGRTGGRGGDTVAVVVMPIFVGNSGNRIFSIQTAPFSHWKRKWKW